jgi:uncharacterized protein involved in exopolysaccharide biosynthesis
VRQPGVGYVATQVDIIMSRNVALKVVDKLTDEERFIVAESFLGPDARRAVDSDVWVRGAIAGELLSGLSVTPARDSRVLNLIYTTIDPELAATVANAFANAYIDTTLELNMEPARRNAEWFDEQIKSLRTALEDKQKLLTAYQERNGIVSMDTRLDTETRRFQELSTRLLEAQTNRHDVDSRQLGRQHPEYVRAVERETAVQGALDEQQQRLFELRRLRDELDLLVRDVENARVNYDAALQRFSQSSLESQFNQTSIAILNEAPVPAQPSWPNLRVNVALAVVLGIVFGFGFALLSEALDRRIRTEDDIAEGLALPVLASL